MRSPSHANMPLRFLLVIAALSAHVGIANAYSDQPPPGQLPDGVKPLAYRLELRIDPRLDRFDGTVSIDIEIAEKVDRVWLHGKSLVVSKATLTDRRGKAYPVNYEEVLDSGVARLDLPAAIAGRFTLTVDYSAPFDTSGSGLYKSVHREDAYVASQFQAIGARQVFPGFDEPRFKVPFDITLIVPEGMAAFTATPVDRVSAERGWVRQVHETTRPLPTYLLAFAVGPYDVLSRDAIPPGAHRDDPVPLRGVAVRGQGPKLAYPLDNTEEILVLLEEFFGTPYPYSKLDLVSTPFHSVAGMENAGLIMYHDSYLLVDDGSSVVSRRWFVMVHAHELAHQWFGNLVTPSWWDDAWLNESFATWMGMRVGQEVWPAGNFSRWGIRWAQSAMESDSIASVQPIRSEITRNESINDAFDAVTYLKGGGVLSMFELYLGDEAFRNGVRYHLERFADGVATADDFFESLATASGDKRTAAALRSFIDRPGVPMLDIETHCEDDRPRLRVTQTRYSPLGSNIDPLSQQWQIPLCASIYGGQSATTHCHLLEDRTEDIELPAESCDVVVQPNAGAAGYYRYTVGDESWRKLIGLLPEMGPGEALAVGDSLGGAFRSGMLSADLYADGLTALTGRPEWDVVYATTGQLEMLLAIADPKDIAALRARFRDLLAPGLAEHGKGSEPNALMFQSLIATFLVEHLDDPELLEPLAERAARYIGVGVASDRSVLKPDELAAALAAGVTMRGEEFSETLLKEALATQDPEFRQVAFGALARLPSGPVIDSLLNMVASGELDGEDVSTILVARFSNPETRDAIFKWMRDNSERALAAIPSNLRTIRVGRLGQSFCSTKRAEDWREFVVENAELLPGYEQPLADTTREISRCAALSDARAAAVADAFL